MAGFIDDSDVLHIFRDAVGHVPDTAQNRRLLIETLDPAYLLGNDRFGNSWYARPVNDASQIWIQARGDRIRNGGINLLPRSFSPITGLSGAEK